MGAGTIIAGMGATVGIVLVIIGALLSMTGIGAILGIPLILIGIAAIAGGAVGGATVGAAKAAYQVSKKTAAAHCTHCGETVNRRARFCGECGERI